MCVCLITLTLHQCIERVYGGEVGGDADVILTARRLDVHRQRRLHVAMETGDDASGEGDIGQASLAVVAVKHTDMHTHTHTHQKLCFATLEKKLQCK